MAKNKKTGQRRRKIKKHVPSGIAHIHSTSNNTIVTFTDEQGNVVSWASSGSIGYKGTRKSTPYAASLASEAAAKKALEAGMKSLVISTNGVGPGKDTAIRALANFNFNVTVIRDVTAVPHNGTRPPKKPR